MFANKPEAPILKRWAIQSKVIVAPAAAEQRATDTSGISISISSADQITIALEKAPIYGTIPL
jgi:hypothetical protein